MAPGQHGPWSKPWAGKPERPTKEALEATCSSTYPQATRDPRATTT